MFRSVLVANRGEIAVRIIRTLRYLGIRAVLAAAWPDRASLAAELADEVVILPGSSAAETYLSASALVEAARLTGCEALHPGYGFLSEAPALAEACAAAGVVFVGPPPSVLRALGDKAEARRIARQAGVPVVPGAEGDAEALLAQAAALRFPLMVKARGGGGGRGMRAVHSPAELAEALSSAAREAGAAFGDGRVFVEELVPSARHVEVQIIADAHGAMLHLGERDCSLQRRHQKLVEESPSPAVDEELRTALAEAALRVAAAVGYRNAGTVEFLVGPPGADGRRPFYFLEVNPRLQVEHPITEARTGLDLVELQLRVAAGEPLPLRQEDLRFTGHAIEFRINAEDPFRGFQPAAGLLERFGWVAAPEPAWRLEAGYRDGDRVPAAFDSLLGKVIVWGADRVEALEAAGRALARLAVAGVPTTLPLHRALLQTEEFRSGNVTTGWLEASIDGVLALAGAPEAAWEALQQALPSILAEPSSPWTAFPFWFGAGETVAWADDGVEVRALPLRPRRGTPLRDPAHRLDSEHVLVNVLGSEWLFRLVPPPPLPRRQGDAAAAATAVVAPLAGRVVHVAVREGDPVAPGVLVAVLEAMKMEHRVFATAEGTVREVHVRPGDTVREGDLLATLE
ncbi:MAG: ATP-grasp domain-containing protein [Dehalococcoidia bacterium]|nr:ATP-grasp domain-containing protein [Dehalococcoidia bacterium]